MTRAGQTPPPDGGHPPMGPRSLSALTWGPTESTSTLRVRAALLRDSTFSRAGEAPGVEFAVHAWCTAFAAFCPSGCFYCWLMRSRRAVVVEADERTERAQVLAEAREVVSSTGYGSGSDPAHIEGGARGSALFCPVLVAWILRGRGGLRSGARRCAAREHHGQPGCEEARGGAFRGRSVDENRTLFVSRGAELRETRGHFADAFRTLRGRRAAVRVFGYRVGAGRCVSPPRAASARRPCPSTPTRLERRELGGRGAGVSLERLRGAAGRGHSPHRGEERGGGEQAV